MKRRIDWSTRPCKPGDHGPNPSSLALRDDEVVAVCVGCGTELTSRPAWVAAADKGPRCADCGHALPWCECDLTGGQ